MNKTRIKWCDMTWNPVTGCRHTAKECGVHNKCYARNQARRFIPNLIDNLKLDKKPISINGNLVTSVNSTAAFMPLFWPHRLDQPQKIKTPKRVFVVSMGDLFGKWVPDEWITSVFDACLDAPQHIYYFLTKNPKRYKLDHGYPVTFFAGGKPYWFGFSATGQKDFFVKLAESPKGNFGNRFVSFEPLQSAIKIPSETEAYQAKKLNWLIVGAQTNPLKLPERAWVISIRKQCKSLNIPLFEKDSLKPLDLPGELIQEWPE